MGDFLSPQRRVAKERLRSRIEEYRQRMNGCLGRYESRCNERNEQYRQDTQLLHQRWLESREKKAGKQTKTNKESNPLSEQRNLVLSQKLKRKLEASEGGSADHGPFTFNDDPVERPPLKKRPGGVDLSVQIVQQINSQPEHSQTIETNVTVSSTLKSLHGNRGNRDSPHPGGHQGLTSIRTSTSVECKQEPSDDAQCLEPQGNHSGYNSEFDDDLQALLETLEKEGGLSEDILNDLVKFDKLDDVCYKVSAETKDTGAGDSMNVGPGPPKGVSPAIAPAPSGTPTSMTQIYDVNQNMDGLQSTVPVGQFRPSSNQSQMGGIAETGPAAETLKQMAAHHQNQQPPPAYGPMKSSPMSPYPDPLHEERFLQQRNGFQSFQQQGFSTIPQQNGQNPALYPYSQQPVSLAPAKDPHLTYGRTKPLSHFPDPMGGQPTSGQPPSSLQQLQNQVRAQFSNAPTPQMQISQSQQMQITQGHHRMQMSQSQQMQMQQPPRQFTMSQQQSFNMGGNMPPTQAQFVNDPVKMQMYQEKMRQDHQQQLMEQQRRAQMQQFMNRPPPEYKMQGSVNTSPAFGVNGSMGPSPLQTMQNMVNQTNTIPGGYSQVKSEVGSINPQAVGSQVGPMGSGAPVAGSQNIHPDMVTNASQMDGYATQMQQRQQMYKQSQLAAAGQLPVTANLNRAPRPAAPTYSSSIMRNQRPPNVNVGPEGLNISQPRNPVEWHRPMLGGSGGVRPGLPHGQVNRPAAPGSIMPYTPYTNSTSGMQMQQQRTAQMTAMQGQNVVMQSNAQAMMQHRMQMSQQMVLRQAQTGSSPYPVNPAVSMSTQGSASAPGQSSHPQNYSGPVPTSAPTSVPSSAPSSQADFPLDFLDNAQTTNSDFFDSMVQSTNSSDFAILDEILGK